ncbi:WD repeat-containing protein 55 homolog [Adelges cooleyi]|uniref:WD repeat-containing protein 55 homolog n=1 Tax=Adelges cooleyi TaxID=133065 RepID=UPI0021804076|nr:WD repeat-containing protein 55 homolog [Adelges cooleyi]XP_050433685.1 WD repeat-containing protein 55 homolog [Adelges cooleyi]XP_050433686.1 WD repeat-containing protein 55 homolog [Adelges cooleyi]
MCLPEYQKPIDDLPVSDEEVDEVDNDEEQVDGDADAERSSSSNGSTSDSSIVSWISEHDYANDLFDGDVSMSDDSDDIDNMGDDTDGTSDDGDDDDDQNLVPNGCDDDDDSDSNDDDDDDEDEEEEEDDVVAAFLAASSTRNRNHPPNLNVGSNVLVSALSFHPCTNVIAFGLSNGDISMYTYNNERNEHLRTNDNVHLKKVMILEFDESGQSIYSACKENNVSVSDIETGKMKVYFEKAHKDGGFITSLCLLDENSFATGDEDGIVNVWDVRAHGCRFSLKKTDDSINSIIALDDKSRLACASSDGVLTVIDLATKKMILQSEPYKSVLTSCVTMKRKTKVVCGTGEGSLITFNAGDYAVYNDEFPCVDKGAVVNKLVPVTENIVLSALDNGKIRATNLFPNCHLGIVGHHQATSVDMLDISDNGRLIASSSCFSNIVKFWNIEFFEDFDIKKHLKTVNAKDFNLPSSNAVNATDFFSGLQ